VGRGSLAAAGIGLGLLVSGTLQAQPRFITVTQSPEELAADRALADRLGTALVPRPDRDEYKVVIEDLVADRGSEGIVARVTPYAFVVAEMLGAKMDLIATFRSRASGTTTYGAYLVVRRSDFPQGSAPTLSDVMDYLQRRSANASPARFVYHDRFSTSSYFFPSLYFRGQKVFAQTGDQAKDSTAISVERLPVKESSSELVDAVADSRADVASVWDGARAKFAPARDPQHAAVAEKVWFVRFPGNLPDDVLVATRKAHAVGDAIRARLAQDKDQGTYPAGSDVQAWVLWSDGEAEAARMALAELRRQAAPSTLPVVVEVRAVAPRPGGPAPASADEVEAVRQAMRLAGTELVGMSGHSDDYDKSDVVWELGRIHDGALQLTVRYDHFFLDSAGKEEVKQEFPISYRDLDDLTRRVSLLVSTRMHRIRPVWLYWDTAPTVIRDVAFDTPSGMDLPFQEVLWKDPLRNDYTVKNYRVAQLVSSDSSTLELARTNFPERSDKTLAFEPMSRNAFRVLLLRPTRERPMFEALTVAFVALFVLAAIGLVWDARRDWGQSSAPAVPEREAQPPALLPEPHAAALTTRA